MDIDLTARRFGATHMPAMLSKALDNGAPVNDATPPMFLPVCPTCGQTDHPHPQTLCDLMASIEAERDAMIQAILAHRQSLADAGLGGAPEDLRLWASLPAWVHKHFVSAV